MAEKTGQGIVQTIKLIHDVWPDFVVSKEDFLHPKPEFYTRFFTNFVMEMNQNISVLAHDEAMMEPIEEMKDFDRTVRLYRNVTKFYKIYNLVPVNLIDFFEPQPKRTFQHVKQSIHLLVYVSNFIEDMGKSSDDIFEKCEKMKNLQICKEKCLEDNSKIAENIGKVKDDVEKLNVYFETVVKPRHNKMLKEKIHNEKIYCQKMAEVNKLQEKADNLDYQLQDLQSREIALEKLIVTEEHFESLKNAAKYLEPILEQVEHEINNHDDGNAESFETIKFLENYARELENISYDSLKDVVNSLRESRKGMEHSKNALEKIKHNQNATSHELVNKENAVRNKKEKAEYLKKICAERRLKFKTDCEIMEKQFAKKMDQFRADTEASRKLQAEISSYQKKLNNIENTFQILAETYAECLETSINADMMATAHFRNIFNEIKRRLGK